MLVVLGAAAGCNEIHKNDRQIISAEESRPRLGFMTTIYSFTATDELSHLQTHMGPGEYGILQNEYALKQPMLELEFNNTTKCYRMKDPTNPRVEAAYARTVEVRKGVLLTSTGKTCLAKGKRASHDIGFLMVDQTRLKPLNDSNFSKSFDAWASDKSTFYRMSNGLSIGRSGDGEKRASANDIRPYIDYFNETFRGATVDMKASQGIGHGHISLIDKTNLENVKRAEARAAALQARWQQHLTEGGAKKTPSINIGDMSLGAGRPANDPCVPGGDKDACFAANMERSRRSMEARKGLTEALENYKAVQQKSQSAPKTPAAPPAQPKTAAIIDRAPTEAEMLAAMRSHWGAKVGANMFRIRGVQKSGCEKLQAWKYRCSYKPDLEADCVDLNSCLVALTPRGWNTAIFTRFREGWSFSGAE